MFGRFKNTRDKKILETETDDKEHYSDENSSSDKEDID